MPAKIATGSVLVLSADPILRRCLGQLLHDRGRSVAEPEMVGDPSLRCVVADLDWPTRGLSLSWLRAHFPHTPCVLLSGSPLAGPDTATALRRGYFLQKPVAARQLLNLIEDILDGR